jgi:hypothetical protein
MQHPSPGLEALPTLLSRAPGGAPLPAGEGARTSRGGDSPRVALPAAATVNPGDDDEDEDEDERDEKGGGNIDPDDDEGYGDDEDEDEDDDEDRLWAGCCAAP